MRSLIFILTLSCVISIIGFAQNRAKTSKLIRIASFPGNTDSMVKYLSTNIHFSKHSRDQFSHDQLIKGRVILRVVINESGHTEQISVLQGIGRDCDSEAVRAVKAMPPWTPALYNGKPVKAVVTIPIRFCPE